VLERTLERLAAEAQVERCLVIGGDVDRPVGEFDAAIQLIETGLFQKYGVKRVALAVHPEGHPRVADEVMWPALPAKLEAARRAGLETYLVSQFAFDAAPYVTTARRLRASGLTEPLRVGVAGPAKRTTLIKYALMCGVGASLRAVRERHELAANLAGGETPEGLLRQLAAAQAKEPSLGIDSVHFFTFGSLESSVTLAEQLRGAEVR
jgi:methylenetetrahydrofolate reductase (NADPH)